jgi:hypothetical protein
MTFPVTVPFANAESDPGTLESVKNCLVLQEISADFIRVDGRTAYAELFSKLWSQARPFIIVEHDILPWPGALRELTECPEPWCGFTYRLGRPARQTYPSLIGCTKFEPLRLGSCPISKNLHWKQLDGQIGEVLHKERSIKMHHHYPEVGHLHNYEKELARDWRIFLPIGRAW